MATFNEIQADPIVIDLESERTRRSPNGRTRRDLIGRSFLADLTSGEDPCLLMADPAYADTAPNSLRAFVADYPVEAGALVGCEYNCPFDSCFKRRLNIPCQ